MFTFSGGPGRHTNNGKAYCFELATGKIMWEETKLFIHPNYSSPLLADGKIIAINQAA